MDNSLFHPLDNNCTRYFCDIESWLEKRPCDPNPNIRCYSGLKTIIRAAIIVIILRIIVAQILRYLYNWTNHNEIIGYFAPNKNTVWA